MITAAYITGRRQPRFDWFFDSLRLQKRVEKVTQITVVDFYAQVMQDWPGNMVEARRDEVLSAAARADFEKITQWVPPKPTIWQGPHRVTRGQWWANSSNRNTAICLCRNPYLLLLDDRCVLLPGVLDGAWHSIKKKYAMCGGYEKRHDLGVMNGVITASGIVSGSDNRDHMANGKIVPANGAWFYGCLTCVPIEWWLNVNGYPEDADALSFEDVLAGMAIHNNGYPIRFNPNARIVEDRTPSQMDKPFLRTDKGVSPLDKSHKSLEVLGGAKRFEHSWGHWNLREIREQVLNGGAFPIPDPNAEYRDWFDGSLINGL